MQENCTYGSEGGALGPYPYRNDPAWMPGLGEGHHGCVYDEPDTGTVLTAHRDDGNL